MKRGDSQHFHIEYQIDINNMCDLMETIITHISYKDFWLLSHVSYEYFGLASLLQTFYGIV